MKQSYHKNTGTKNGNNYVCIWIKGCKNLTLNRNSRNSKRDMRRKNRGLIN